MGVSVGDVDTLMPHTLCNSQGSKAHVDQQTDVAMSQIVYTNAFYPSLLTATVHFSMEIAFADGKHPAVRLHAIELLEVVLQLITEELRHLDHAVTLGCFRCSDHILLIEPLVRLIDGDGALFKVKICWGQGQQLCFCQYKSKKNLLLIRKKHHCFHPVMLLRTILFRLCFFFFVENVIHLPAYLHTTWFINKDFLNNL